jgi:hypothetical protein
MITLTAKINLMPNNNGSFNRVTLGEITPINVCSINVDNPSQIVGTKKQAKNVFMLGVSKFSDNGAVYDNLDYLISRQISDETGKFASHYPSISISGNIGTVNIAFDTENNTHPLNIKKRHETQPYQDDDAIFMIPLNINDSTVTLDILDWNKANAPLIITGIYTEISIIIDRKNLIDISSNLFYRENVSMPSYGVISNTGEISFNDLNGEIRDYIEEQLLKENIKVEISLNNTLSKGKQNETVGNYYTNKWTYDNDNRQVAVTLKDELEEWQDIQIKGFNYDQRNPKAVLPNQNLADLYKWLQDPKHTPTKYKMLPFERLDTETIKILTQTHLDYPYLNDGSLWEQWTKICQACQLYIYKKKNGTTVCSHNLGA